MARKRPQPDPGPQCPAFLALYGNLLRCTRPAGHALLHTEDSELHRNTHGMTVVWPPTILSHDRRQVSDRRKR